MALFHTTVLDNQIKALPTVDTASGSIASFNTDLTENLVEVKCQIVAKQASGTPSPVNPLPITTYTEMNVGATGKNLFDKSNLTGCVTLSGQLYQNGKGGISIDETSTGWESTQQLVNYGRGVLLGKLLQGTYTISFTSQATSASLWVAYTDTDQLSENTGLSRTNVVSTSGSGYQEITFNADGTHYYWFIAYISSATAYSYSDFMLEKGSRATTYEPFGTTKNIPFGQTVANGVLDITTGKLRVTHKAKDLGNLNYSYNSSNQAFITNDVVGISEGAEIILSCYTDSGFVSVTTMPNNTAQLRTNALYIKNSAYTDPSLFKTAMNGQTIVYEANETIQLDSKTITTLLNENNIWCDTGDTEVKFLLTVGKKIS